MLYAKARRFEPLGFRFFCTLLLPTKLVHPVHLAVICQCVPLVCVPVFRTWSVAPVQTCGAVRTLDCLLAKFFVRKLGQSGWEITYLVRLTEETTWLPEAQEMVSGLLTMLAPQARPVQPTALGATICSTTSKPCVAGLGTATRKEMYDPITKAALKCEKVKPVSASRTMDVSAARPSEALMMSSC